MNKKTLWIVIGIIVIAAILYFALRPQDAVNNTGEQSTNSTTMSEQTLKDLVMAGRPMQCTFKEEGSEGTVYVSGKNVRGDFSAIVEGKPVMSHMITADNTSYIWMDGQTTGFKMTIDPEAAESTEQADAPVQGIDENKKMNYSCSNWSGDTSKFAVPSNIDFQDFSSLMPTQVQTETNNSANMNANAAQCAACDSAPAASREQCRAALGCK